MSMQRIVVMCVIVVVLCLTSNSYALVYDQSTADATWLGYAGGGNPTVWPNPFYGGTGLEVQGGLNNAGRRQFALLNWDLSSLTGVISVESATLTVHVSQAGRQGTAAIAAYAVSSGNSWEAANATYAQRNTAGDNWLGTGAYGASASQDPITYPGNIFNTESPQVVYPTGGNYYLDLNVQAIVEDWLVNGAEQNGFGIDMPTYISSSTDYLVISGPANAGTPLDRHPVLNIEYTVPEPASLAILTFGGVLAALKRKKH